LPDYAISSYTPTVTALLSRRPASPTLAKGPFRMTVAIESKTLQSTVKELAKIQDRVPKAWLQDEGTFNVVNSVDALVPRLRSSSIIHFACHGIQDFDQPLNSALILNEGKLKVSELLDESLPDASLAFLCACQTATGDDRLPDEVIHLAATLLFAGFRGTVAAMWSIADSDGPEVADMFYEQLFQSSLNSDGSTYPDTTQAARALHVAVTKLRREMKVPFRRWLPFVHFGL